MRAYFVTGATSPLGRRVLQLLAHDPVTGRIVGVDRDPLGASAPKLAYVQGDLEQLALEPLLDGVDVVVHIGVAAGSEALRRLLRSVERSAVRRVVVISSVAVYGAWPNNDVPLTERSPLRPNPGFDYAVNLAEQERLLGEWSASHDDVATVVLRLAMLLGNDLEAALSQALGTFQEHRPARSSRPVQFLHADDAAAAIALAATSDLEGHYNVAPRGFIGDAVARAVAGVAPRPGLPRRFAHVLNDLVWRRRYRIAYAAAAPYFEHPMVMASDRLRARGWEPAYESDEALVVESRPSWWGRLMPQAQRSIVSSGLVGAALSWVGGGALLATWLVLRRGRRRAMG